MRPVRFYEVPEADHFSTSEPIDQNQTLFKYQKIFKNGNGLNCLTYTIIALFIYCLPIRPHRHPPPHHRRTHPAGRFLFQLVSSTHKPFRLE